MTTILDANLMAHERVNFHPLVNSMTTGISRDDLIRFLRATGHEPTLVQLPEPPTDASAGRDAPLWRPQVPNPEPAPAPEGRRRRNRTVPCRDDCLRAIPIPSET